VGHAENVSRCVIHVIRLMLEGVRIRVYVPSPADRAHPAFVGSSRRTGFADGEIGGPGASPNRGL
jgi:hypothetical protein